MSDTAGTHATFAALDVLRANGTEAQALAAARDAVMPGGRNLSWLESMEATWAFTDALESHTNERAANARLDIAAE